MGMYDRGCGVEVRGFMCCGFSKSFEKESSDDADVVWAR